MTRLAVGALLAVHAGLAWLAREPYVLTGQDDAYYLMLARALRQFTFADIYLAEITTRPLYPPGYPAILAIWGGIVGDRYDLLLLLNIAFSVGALLCVYLVIRKVWGEMAALICLAPMVANPYLVDSAGNLMSEAPYTFFSIAAVTILALRPQGATWLVAAGAAAVMAGLTRGIGVTIIGAVAVTWLLQRRWAATAALGAASGLTVGAWLLWMTFAPEQFAGRSYAADFTYIEGDSPARSDAHPAAVKAALTLAGRMVTNVPAYLSADIPYRLPLPTITGTPIDNAAGALVTVGGLVVGCLAFLRHWRAAGAYLLLYGGLLAIWSWQVGRFVIPALPLLVPAVLLGTGALARAARPRWWLPVTGALAAVLALNGAGRSAGLITGRAKCERGHDFPHPTCLTETQHLFFEGVRYVTTETPEDAVFLSGKPITLYHYSGRQAALLQQAISRDPSGFLPSLRLAGVDYIFLSNLHDEEANRLAPLIEANCEHLPLVAEFSPENNLFRVPETATDSGDSRSCDAIFRYRSVTGRHDGGSSSAR